MDIDQFLKALSNIPNRFHLDWQYIRDENCDCPINALLRSKDGYRRSDIRAMENAQEELGMSFEEALLIIWAADKYNWFKPEVKALRAKLLVACKLPQET